MASWRLFSSGDAPRKAHKNGVGVGEDFAQYDAGATRGESGMEFPELGFDAEEAADEPFIADEVVDLETDLSMVGSTGDIAFFLAALKIPGGRGRVCN